MLVLSYTEDEALLQEVARDFLKNSVTPTAIRDAETGPEGYDAAVWKQIQDLGWVGLPFPESVGGEGANFSMLAVLAEELGRACYPGPLRAAWDYGLLLQGVGDDDQLKALIKGQEVGVAALWEADQPYKPESTEAKLNADGTVSGVKLLVPYANAASRILALVKDSSGTLRLALLETSSVKVENTPSSSGDRYFAVRLDGATPLKVYDGDAGAVLKAALPKMAAIDCAWMVGLAAKAYEMTIEYVKGRVQFGRPIGAFQAVQHKIVDVGVAVEGGRFLAYKAAWAVEQSQEEGELAVHYAKAHLNYASEDIIKQTFQVTGAMGMTWEYDLQLALRRLKASAVSHGDYHSHRDAVVTAISA